MAFRVINAGVRRVIPSLSRHCGNTVSKSRVFNVVRGQCTSSEQTTPASGPVKDAMPAEELGKLHKMLEERNQSLEQLQEKVEDLEDKYKRSIAETENVRQRMYKQIEEAKVFGIQSFSADLLEVADILGRALESVPEKSSSLDEGKALWSLQEGMKLTEAQLLKVFMKYGLQKVQPLEGDEFDPNLHEALFQVAGGEAGRIAQLSQIGYQLHRRTIRPAKVGVFKEQ
nr:molecular chaperone GrpE [Halisarca dujardinii]